MKNVEHIGIAVQDLNKANLIYTALLGTGPYKTETVATEKVTTSFFKTGESKIELLAATDDTSVIANFIRKRGEGLHHVAFAVNDIVAEMNRLKQAGFTLLSETPKAGADNKLICFVHPKETTGVLIELCQEKE